MHPDVTPGDVMALVRAMRGLVRVCAADDPAAVADLYARDECRVPAELIG